MPDWTPYEKYKKDTYCPHLRTRPTQATKSNGVMCVYLQCTECGEKTKEASKSGYDVLNLPLFDEAIRDAVRAKNADILNEIKAEWTEETEQERTQHAGDFWEDYNAYLLTDHWQQIRRRALVRDGFLCQNCFCKLTESSAIGHHLSYESYKRLGYSFTFEIVALCRTCHNDYHGKQSQ